MERTRTEPLGVPGTDYHSIPDSPQERSSPKGLDRWLVSQIVKRIGNAPIRVALWDERDVTPRDGTVLVRIHDRKALFQLVSHPDLHFGDLYSAGRVEVRGSLLQLLEEAYRLGDEHPTLRALIARGRALAPDRAESKRNIHHHYDIGNEFYTLWLDREALQYTCAYYAAPGMTIEQAQQAKMHHVCRKLQLKSGERVVEAGSGWGGFALFMAKNYGVKVRTFNISHEQVLYAREWAGRLGLTTDQVEFVEDDYRNLTGTYDAFVSIGMLEHVGAGNYKELGSLMRRAIRSDGRGLVHSIGRDKAGQLNAWIDKRIFPGAQPPTLREMMDLFEPNDLSVLDVENIRLHYARTLEHWLERYEESVDRVRAMFDETFVRAWRLYLTGSIAAFTTGKLQLFQVLYARSGADNVPWTRKHVYAGHP